MYEINTHNLKLYLSILSIIFILTNGFPLLTIFENKYINHKTHKNQQNNIDIDNNNNNNNNNLKGDNFIIVNNNNNNNNYYTTNATVIKQSVMYNTYTNSFTGSIILEHKNYIDNNYHYCKIDISEQPRTDIINEYIYKYFNLSRTNIVLYCNKNECIYKLYKYENGDNEENSHKYEELICNILTIKKLNNEL